MRAVVWKKAHEVAVEEVPKPEIVHPDDIIIKCEFCSTPPLYDVRQKLSCVPSSDDDSDMWKARTSSLTMWFISQYCDDSDLNIYEGRSAIRPGLVLGHEKSAINLSLK